MTSEEFMIQCLDTVLKRTKNKQVKMTGYSSKEQEEVEKVYNETGNLNEASRKTGISVGTVHHIMKRKGRKSRKRKLCEFEDVPDSWVASKPVWIRQD